MLFHLNKRCDTLSNCAKTNLGLQTMAHRGLSVVLPAAPSKRVLADAPGPGVGSLWRRQLAGCPAGSAGKQVVGSRKSDFAAPLLYSTHVMGSINVFENTTEARLSYHWKVNFVRRAGLGRKGPLQRPHKPG